MKQMSDAEKMREKQRKADLKKAGIVEEEPKEEKVYDDSFLKEFEKTLTTDDELPESKIGWKCIFNSSTMFSDGYAMETSFDGAVMEVKSLNIGESVCSLVE